MSRLFEDFFDDIEDDLIEDPVNELYKNEFDMKLDIRISTYMDFSYKIFKSIKLGELKLFITNIETYLDICPVLLSYELKFMDEHDKKYSKDDFINYISNSFDAAKKFLPDNDDPSVNVGMGVSLNLKFDINRPNDKRTFEHYYNLLVNLYYTVKKYALKIESYEVETEELTKNISTDRHTPDFSVFSTLYYIKFVKSDEMESVVEKWSDRELPHFELKEMPHIGSTSKKKRAADFRMFNMIYATESGQLVSQKTNYPVGIVIGISDSYISVISTRCLSLYNPNTGSQEQEYSLNCFYEDSRVIDNDYIFTSSNGRHNQYNMYNYANQLIEQNREVVLKNFDNNWKKGSLTNEATDKNCNMPAIVSLSRFRTKGSKAGQWRFPCFDEIHTCVKNDSKMRKIFSNHDLYYISFSLNITNTLESNFMNSYVTITSSY